MPLYPPTIHGGTEEQQHAVMDTWSEFIDDIKLTPPNVRVEFVELIEEKDWINGSYSPGVIKLRSDLDINKTKNQCIMNYVIQLIVSAA